MKALIIDDEKTAILNLESILADCYPGFFSTIAGVQTIGEALKQVETNAPDVVFLDVQLQEGSGFDFLALAGPRDFRVIFVTAYDQYAIRAIRLNAFDYLLKPIDIDDLGQCLERLLVDFTLPFAGAAETPPRSDPDYIVFRDTHHFEKILFSHIDYLEASGPYTNIVYTKNNQVARGTKSKSLHEFEELLPARDFLRIHRSYLVNLHHIERLVKQKEKLFVQLASALLPVSRRRYRDLAASIPHEKTG